MQKNPFFFTMWGMAKATDTPVTVWGRSDRQKMGGKSRCRRILRIYSRIKMEYSVLLLKCSVVRVEADQNSIRYIIYDSNLCNQAKQ